ncbi:MAG: PEP-CTERM sorting domain-containing protein [bacterium]|nr:PEP-CTERM sorting domain-containing protein [bacterium]
MSRRLSLLIAVVAGMVPAFTALGDVVIYSNAFEGSVGAEWSMLPEGGSQWTAPPTGTTPLTQDGFLGEFGNCMVTLTLDNLPAHAEVSVAMDLFVIRSWDGNYDQDARGPDFWAYAVDSVPTDPEDPAQWDSVTTFSNWDPGTGPRQAYPLSYPVGDFPARQGASENNTLGFLFDDGGGPVVDDAVYELNTGVLPHTGGSLVITFGADHLQSLSDESWGIDDVVVTLDVPEPGAVALLTLGTLAVLRRRR